MTRRSLLFVVGVAAALALAPSNVVPALSKVVIATSVSVAAPCTAQIEATIQSYLRLGAPVEVVADAIPTAADAIGLDTIDAGKWEAQWRASAAAYEVYLDRLEALTFDGRVTVRRAPAFGHLVGSVRLGLDGMDGDDVVLVTQHDLVLGPALDEGAVAAICASIVDAAHPARYVLLERDANSSPRSRRWFGACDATVPAAALVLRDLCGGFSDQAHFANVAWYRDEVLGRCGARKTCMEHVVHPMPGELAPLGGSTFALCGGPYIYDLVHGAAVPTPSLPQLRGWQSVGEGTEALCIDPWSVVHWRPRPDRGIEAKGVANHVGGDPSHAAQAISFFADVHVAEKWRVDAFPGKPVRAVALPAAPGGSFFCAGAGVVQRRSWETGAVAAEARRSSAVLSLALVDGGAKLVLGDMSPGVALLDAESLNQLCQVRDSSGWVRHVAVIDGGEGGALIASIGCDVISLRLPASLERTAALESGPSLRDAEPWRRHDVTSFSARSGTVVAGLVDGSLRVWRGLADAPTAHDAHGDRIVFVGLLPDGTVVTVDRASARTWRLDDGAPQLVADAPVPARVLCADASQAFVALGTADGRVVLYGASSLEPLLDYQASAAAIQSLEILDGSSAILAGDAHGCLIRLDVL
ncbi:hypothetical protein M885DRAFT_517130 [Pelagophyceae sp. CCMP2097]|nr:hypothetical protein M885DRAFT_517130 [Pelagophyceae sp. CCMP2097]